MMGEFACSCGAIFSTRTERDQCAHAKVNPVRFGSIPVNPIMHDWVQHPDRAFGAVTLRDYFAAQSLVGMLSSYPSTGAQPSRDGFAKVCYEFADAMLKAREGDQ